MALTIAVTSLKGGVGKSLISINIAAYLHEEGHKVLIGDCDSQGSCRTWAAVAAEREIGGPPVVALEGRTLRRDLESVAAGFDVVLLDTPPRMEREAKSAMLVADLVLIPTTSGGSDMWALEETLDVLADARTFRPELAAVIVHNCKKPTALSRLVSKALSNSETRVLTHGLGDRTAFGEAILAGQGVITYAPSSKAAREVMLLTRELLAVIEEEGGKA